MLFLYWPNTILPYKMAAVEQETYGNKLAPHVVYRKAGEVARRAAKTKPNQAKLQYLAKSTSFDILFGETLQASHLQEELEIVNQDIGEWIEQYEGSMETIALLREQLASATSPTSSTASSTSASSTSATSSTTTLVTASAPHQESFVNSLTLDVHLIKWESGKDEGKFLN